MASNIPVLSGRQWAKIENILPATKRDPLLITAVLFHEVSGEPVREAAAAFGLSKTRLNEGHRAIAADLPQILELLGLEPADQLARRRGGRVYAGDPEMTAAIAAIRLQNFAQAMRAGRQGSSTR